MNDADNFEWDNDEAIANWQKHGVSFQQAIRAYLKVIAANPEAIYQALQSTPH